MIPANAILPIPEVGALLWPESLPYDPIKHTVMGGLAIGDVSAGRLYQPWEAKLAQDAITVGPMGQAVAFSLSAPGALTVSLAFDSNMGLAIAWQTAAGSRLYHFGGVTSTYVTRIFSGTTSCRVCVDDARDFYSANSDVIFAYTQSGTLYWRQQRDQYDVPRVVGVTAQKIKKLSLADTSRLQFECF